MSIDQMETIKKEIGMTDNDRIINSRKGFFLIPEIINTQRELPLDRRFERQEDLIGRPSVCALEYIAGRIVDGKIMVPKELFANLFAFDYRFYHKSSEDAHLKEGEFKSRENDKYQRQIVLGFAYLLKGILEKFINSAALNEMFYNCFAVNNRIPIYNIPNQEITCNNPDEPFFVRYKNGRDGMWPDSDEVGIMLDRSQTEALYLMAADFTINNLDLLKEELTRFLLSQNIPLEGFFIQSSDHGMHFISTNPLLTLQQYTNVKSIFHLLNRINDPASQTPIRFDTHHDMAYYQQILGDDRPAMRLDQRQELKSNALRLSPLIGGGPPKIVGFLKISDEHNLDRWKSYKRELAFF